MKHIYVLTLLSFISLFTFAQTPELLKDINLQHSGAGAPSELVSFNSYIYFIRPDDTNGTEVWRTNGTTTEVVSDIDNEVFGDPFSLTVWNGSLYFSTDKGGIWKSDGTPQNTASFTSLWGEIIPGQNVLFVYQTYTDQNTGQLAQYLGGTDGISGGFDVSTLDTYMTDREFAVVGNDIFFTDIRTATGKEVFHASLTDEGGGFYSSSVTNLDKPIVGSVGSDPANLTVFNGKCYWVALKDNSNGNGTGPKGLFESDGTLSGTVEFFTYETNTALPLHATSPKTTDITVVNNNLLYYNMTGLTTAIDVDVYSYDGTNTPVFLQQVTNNSPGGIAFLNRLQFLGQIAGNEYYDIPGVGDYQTDGSLVSLSALTFNQTFHINKMVELGSELIYSKSNDDENLYKSDLSGNESVVYTFTSSFNEDRPKELTILGSEVFFIGPDDIEGFQVWKTDGTNPNTTRVTNSLFTATNGSFPTDFFTFDNELYFFAVEDGLFNLYKSDGTEGGTVELLNNVNSAAPYPKAGGVELGGNYLSSFDQFGQKGLIKFNGTTFENLLTETTSNLVSSGTKVFFKVTTAAEGEELGVTDGTVGNTTVLDLFPGAGFSSFPDDLTDVNGTLYFRGTNPTNGSSSIWKSDGTPGGTLPVVSDPAYDVKDMTVVGDYIVYAIDDLIIGEELQVYNILTEEIVKVDLREGSESSFPEFLFTFNDAAYYIYYINGFAAVLGKYDPVSGESTLLEDNLGASRSFDSYNHLLITENTASFQVRENGFNIFDYGITITASDEIFNVGGTSFSQAAVIGDIAYLEQSGTTVRVEALKSEVLELSSQSFGTVFDGRFYYTFEDDFVGLEPHSFTESFRSSFIPGSDMMITQDSASLNLSWTPGTGDSRIVLATINGTNPVYPVDGTVYTPDSEFEGTVINNRFGSSSIIGLGDINTLSVSGFSPGVSYTFTVINIDESDPASPIYDLRNAYSFDFTLEKVDQEIIVNVSETAFASDIITLNEDIITNTIFGLSYTLVSGPASITVFSGGVRTLSFTGEGTVELLVEGFETDNYNAPDPVTVFIEVSLTPQEINFIVDQTTYEYEDESFAFSIESINTLPFTTSVTGSGRATGTPISGITITGGGVITVTVSNDGSTQYEPLNESIDIIIEKTDHTISLGPIDDLAFGTSLFGLPITTTARPGSPVGSYIYEIISGPAEVDPATNQITATGVGTVTVEVSNTGNDNYNPAPSVQGTFEAIKADQSITVNGSLPTEISFADGTYSFEDQFSTPSGDVSLVIISGPGFFTGDNMDIYNITTPGEVTVSAFAPSSEFYNGSLVTEFTFTVTKGDQSIIYNGITNGTANTVTYDPSGIEILAESTSGLDPVFEITSFTEGGTISGNILTVTSAGQFQITISQPGDDNYNAAPDEVQSITVTKADQTITATDIPNQVKGADPITVVASTDSGLDPSITQNTSNISLESGVITILTDAPAGQAQVTISQDGNDVYNAAVPVTLAFCVSPKAPTLTLDGTVIRSDNTFDQHDWYKDDVFLQVSSNSDNFLNISESGTYKAIAQGGSCPDSDFSNEIVFEMVLGLSDELSQMLYPNPARDFLNIGKLIEGRNRNLNFEIFNLAGIRFIEGKVSDRIDISSLVDGVYYLRLSDMEKSIPFIKQ